MINRNTKVRIITLEAVGITLENSHIKIGDIAKVVGHDGKDFTSDCLVVEFEKYIGGFNANFTGEGNCWWVRKEMIEEIED